MKTNNRKQNQLIQYITKTALKDLVYLRQLLDHTEDQQSNSLDFQVIVQSGHCLANTKMGDLITAKKDVDKLVSLIRDHPNEIHDDIQSFAYNEIGYFYYTIDDFTQAMRFKSYALDIAKSEISKLIAERNMIELLLMEKRAEASDMIRIAKAIKQKGLFADYVMTQLKLGNYYLRENAFEDAKHCFDKGTRIAKKHQLHYPNLSIQISLGVMYKRQKEFKKAIRILTPLTQDHKTIFGKIAATANLAQIEKVTGNYYGAITLAKTAVKLAKENRCFSHTPLFYHFLGEIYKKYLNQTEKALYYYKLGYETVMELVDVGITLEGERLNVVKYYNAFLEKSWVDLKERSSIQTHFDFALHKPWKEIQALFQFHLLIAHRDRHQFVEHLLKHLDMKHPTYYAIQNRLKKAGYTIPGIKEPIHQVMRDTLNQPLMDYILNHVYNISWKKANQQFERDVFQFLYQSYGSNRRQMESILKISYPNICLKMKDLNQNRHIMHLQE
ncbi:MAG: hypothetical protein ISR83_01390 [Candidatus Marinimicrobia bacterium]|nr:hypothetical protein [Candidatus Neomarinimicrobiota bacterium]